MSGEWVLDEFRCWNLHHGGAHIWISPRPPYCDRGHWMAQVSGIRDIDLQDGFPRYYMELEVAKREMHAWLLWRLKEPLRAPGETT